MLHRLLDILCCFIVLAHIHLRHTFSVRLFITSPKKHIFNLFYEYFFFVIFNVLIHFVVPLSVLIIHSFI